jgi:hypothetical protein
MLLNNDIQFFFVQTFLHFQKEIYVIMYIIDLKKNSNHLFEQNRNKI